MDFLYNIYLGNELWRYLIFCAFIIGGVLIGRIIHWISSTIMKAKAEKTESKVDDIIVGLIEKPFVFLLVIGGIFFGSKFLNVSAGFSLFISNVISILLILDIAWFIVFILEAILTHYITPLTEKSKTTMDDALMPILKKVVRFIIFFIALIVIIDRFGYDVTSLVAGLGIGGLAFAFAAKDLLANLFGGAAIFTDKPFKLGDRIKVGDNDGFVREIGLRTTRIETFGGTQIIIPNSQVADSVIENISKERMRRVKITVGVTYDTNYKNMQKAKKILEEAIISVKDTDDKSLVNFMEFADSSLNFNIIYWVKNLDNILGAQHNVNMEIKKRFDKAKIDMAFPTRTVYVMK